MIESSLFLDLVKQMIPGKKKSQNKLQDKRPQQSTHLLNLLSQPNCKILLKDFQDCTELIKNVQIQKTTTILKFDKIQQKQDNEQNINNTKHVKYFVQQIYKRRRPSDNEYLKLKEVRDKIKIKQKKQSEQMKAQNQQIKQYNSFGDICQYSEEQKKVLLLQLQNVIATYEQYVKTKQNQTQSNNSNGKNNKKIPLIQQLKLLQCKLFMEQLNSNSILKLETLKFNHLITSWLLKLKIQFNKKYTQTQRYFETCIQDKQLPWINVQCFCSFVKEVSKIQDQKQVKFAIQILHQIIFCQSMKAGGKNQKQMNQQQQNLMLFSDIKLQQHSSKIQILDQYFSLISQLIQIENDSVVDLDKNCYSKFVIKILCYFVQQFVSKVFQNLNAQNVQKNQNKSKDILTYSLAQWIWRSHTLSKQVAETMIKALLYRSNGSSKNLNNQFKQFVIKGYLQNAVDHEKDLQFELDYQLFILTVLTEENNLQNLQTIDSAFSFSYVQLQKFTQRIYQNYLNLFLIDQKYKQKQTFDIVNAMINKNSFQNQNQEIFHMLIISHLFSEVLQKLEQSKNATSNQNQLQLQSKKTQSQQFRQKIYEITCQKYFDLLEHLTQSMKQAHQNLQSAYLSRQNFTNSINVLCQAQLLVKYFKHQQINSLIQNMPNNQYNLKNLMTKIIIQFDKSMQFYHINLKIRQQNCPELIKLCLKQKLTQQKLKIFLNYIPNQIFRNQNQKNKILLNNKLIKLFTSSLNKERYEISNQVFLQQSQKNLNYFEEILNLSNKIRSQLKQMITKQKLQQKENFSVLFQTFNMQWQNSFNKYCLTMEYLNQSYHQYTTKSKNKTQAFDQFNPKLYQQFLQGLALLNQIEEYFYKQNNPMINNSISCKQKLFYKVKIQVQILIKNLQNNQKIQNKNYQKQNVSILQADTFLKDFKKLSRSQQFNAIEHITTSQNQQVKNLITQKFIFKKNCILKELRDLWLTKNNDETIQIILSQNIKKFQFFSQTFNGQLLIFGSIYNPQDQVYFYQNHFEQHLNLQIYSILVDYLIEQNNSSKIFNIFQKLRAQIGTLIESTVYLPQSHHFYTILSILKYSCLTFTQKFLAFIDINELSIFFNLLLEFIKRDNHPLLRQYIQIMLGRVYLSIGKRNQQKRRQMRNKMINMLYIELNTGVPILLLIGYELIDYTTKKLQFQKQENLINKNQKKQQKHYQSHDIQDEYGSLEIKNKHQMDIHFILVKFISCHTAYLRAICQYYLSKYLELQPQPDQLLVNLSKFWKEDKDSSKILYNISLAVDGYKKALQEKDDAKYLIFERVEEYPSQRIKYEFNNQTILFFKLITQKRSRLNQNYLQKKLIKKRINQLQKENLFYIKNTVFKIQEDKIIKQEVKPPATLLKKHVKDKMKNKKIQQNIAKKNEKVEQKQLLSQVSNQILIKAAKSQTQVFVRSKIVKQSLKLSSCPKPKIIIIATLLQKVHNFGYLMRTLTSHSAMLTVPSKQPLLHPQCQQLIPKDMDVQVIQIKKQQLRDFILLQKLNGYPLIALQQCSKSISLQKMKFPQKYMLLLGNQRIGAPGTLLNLADILVQIPQVGKIRSLNVHVSMVICFWEYLKQSKKSEDPNQQNKNLKIEN